MYSEYIWNKIAHVSHYKNDILWPKMLKNEKAILFSKDMEKTEAQSLRIWYSNISILGTETSNKNVNNLYHTAIKVICINGSNTNFQSKVNDNCLKDSSINSEPIRWNIHLYNIYV